MNWIKILKYTGSILAIVIVLFLGFLTYIAFVPPERYQPEDHAITDQSEYELDKKVGWYHFEDDSEWLITWRPYGGLLTLNFVDFANNNLLPETENKFNWFRGGDTLEVTFQDSAEITNRFNWIDSSGVMHSAERMSRPYYHQKELTYNNDDIALKGTLLIPNSSQIESAAVIIHGSGSSHRDNFWYLYQADYFAKKGIMILLPDKRGSGASGGKWHTASMKDFATDAIAGVRKIQELDIRDSLKLGFIGFSQGGVIAPLAAHMFNDTDFVVNVVGSAVTFNEQLEFEIYNDVLASGVPKFISPIVTAAYSRRAKARRPVWWRKNGDYSPTPYFDKLNIPALIVYGGKDTNAPVESSLIKLREIQQKSGGKNITVKVYEDSGHAMGDPETGWIREEYLQFVTEWIKHIEQ